jgi:hypothetical protein
MQPSNTWALLHLDTWVWMLASARWVALLALAGGLGVGTLAARRRSKLWATLAGGLLVASASIYAYALLVSPDARQLQLCRKHVRDLGGAIEAYASTHDGRLPRHLDDLEPTFIAHLPTCPRAGKDTYSGSYQANTATGVFTLCCSGANHSLRGTRYTNLPRYGNDCGVVPAEAP